MEKYLLVYFDDENSTVSFFDSYEEAKKNIIDTMKNDMELKLPEGINLYKEYTSEDFPESKAEEIFLGTKDSWLVLNGFTYNFSIKKFQIDTSGKIEEVEL